MKKRIAVFLLLFTLFLSSCTTSTYRLEKPNNTNLEFWITQEVEVADFAGYQQRYGLFGGDEYYGIGYTPTYDGHNQQIDPEACVIYTVTAYPDYSSKNRTVTKICISDPNVYFYGLTMNSIETEIKKVMEGEGFQNTEGMTFTKGKVCIWFGETQVIIHAEVTNKLGIQF